MQNSPNLKRLSKTLSTSEGNVKVIETIEKNLSAEDLLQDKQRCLMQQQHLIRQMKQLRSQYDSLTATIAEIDEMLTIVPDVEIPEPIVEVEPTAEDEPTVEETEINPEET